MMVLAVLVLLVVGGGILWLVTGRDHAATPSPEPVVATQEPAAFPDSASTAAPTGGTAAAPVPDNAPPADGRPAFDVVQVEKDGAVVAAGRALPNSQVDIRIDGKHRDTVRANERGEWVWNPERPLATGNHTVQAATDTAGGAAAVSDPLVVLVPGKPGQATVDEAPTVVALGDEESGKARVLQRGDQPGGDGADTPVSLDTVQYGAGKPLSLVGSGPAGAHLTVELDGRKLGELLVDANGQWQIGSHDVLTPGPHHIVVYQGGRRIGRYPFSIGDQDDPTAETSTGRRVVVIQPGNNLWRIAERTYGSGLRYTLIFRANQAKIRNPDLIYPGQVFDLPAQ